MAQDAFRARACEICAVCFWEEEDGQDDDADDVLGGSNGNLSLT
ncbi:CPCC family cysteine-rich protein [Xanthomonas sacchari]